jgi:hypothetical protein
MAMALVQIDEVALAARNNAEWCDTMCRARGVIGTFEADLWSSSRRTPRYYPDAITLARSVAIDSVLTRIDTATPGCSVKDSFVDLDLAAAGFRILYEAEWLSRSGAISSRRDTSLTWRRLRDAVQLERWETAWSGGRDQDRTFLPTLLDEPSLRIVGGFRGDRVVGGCVLNLAVNVIGVSNLFASDCSLEAAWAASLAVAAETWPGRTVVGYESGDALAAARAQGFNSIGPVRIWLKEKGRGVTRPSPLRNDS